MKHFTKRLPTIFGSTEFTFNRVVSSSGIRFHVTVMDENRKTFFFNMEERYEIWFILHGSLLPEWITNLEKPLSVAISLSNPFDRLITS